MKELPSFPLYIDSGFDPKGMTKEEMFEIAVSIFNDLPSIYVNVCRIDLHVPWIVKGKKFTGSIGKIVKYWHLWVLFIICKTKSNVMTNQIFLNKSHQSLWWIEIIPKQILMECFYSFVGYLEMESCWTVKV